MLDKFIALVKGQIRHYETQIDRFPPSDPRTRPAQVEFYRRLMNEHCELLVYLEGQLKKTNGATEDPEKPVDIETPGEDNLSDLPEELLAQLSGRAKKGQADPIVQIINDHGGVATLDEILIDLYRRHREINTRTLISNKLYRLGKQGLVKAIEGKKGVYTTALT
jgi:hypothetical protein